MPCLLRGKRLLSGLHSPYAGCSRRNGIRPLLEQTAQADVVCGCCPNLRDGVCNTAEKVLSYDQQVLARCGLEPGRVLPWSEFSRLVSQHILRPKTREEICGGCEWNSLCRSREDTPNFG